MAQRDEAPEEYEEDPQDEEKKLRIYRWRDKVSDSPHQHSVTVPATHNVARSRGVDPTQEAFFHSEPFFTRTDTPITKIRPHRALPRNSDRLDHMQPPTPPRAPYPVREFHSYTITRVIKLAWKGERAGIEFQRSTHWQQCSPPSPPIKHSINSRILPPSSHSEALASMTYTTGDTRDNLPLVTTSRGTEKLSFTTLALQRQEALIEIPPHDSDFFCAVFSKAPGIYEVARIISPAGTPKLTLASKIFAPSVWKNNATIVANSGTTTDNKTRLICRSYEEELFILYIEKWHVAIREQHPKCSSSPLRYPGDTPT
ncbi:hypothetical protein DFH06DRAFT_1126087 [Mycena polygramma]|nr:hypothetical protein DFH06DRAFT_1126087 [Mycena polygramma]